MIYLKNLNGQIREYKDHDARTINTLISSGRWAKVVGRKDGTFCEAPKKQEPKQEPNKATKKTKKKSK